MSFYVLEILLKPGELTRKDYYIYNNLEKIKEKLYQYLLSSTGCFETIWYGSEINIYLAKDYSIIKKINMHDNIIYELDEYPCIYFDNDMPIAIRKDDTIMMEKDAEFDEYFCFNVCNDYENINITINWETIENLDGKLLDKTEIFNIKNFHYDDKTFHYGYNDLLFENNFNDDNSDIYYSSDSEEDYFSYDEL